MNINFNQSFLVNLMITLIWLLVCAKSIQKQLNFVLDYITIADNKILKRALQSLWILNLLTSVFIPLILMNFIPDEYDMPFLFIWLIAQSFMFLVLYLAKQQYGSFSTVTTKAKMRNVTNKMFFDPNGEALHVAIFNASDNYVKLKYDFCEDGELNYEAREKALMQIIDSTTENYISFKETGEGSETIQYKEAEEIIKGMFVLGMSEDKWEEKVATADLEKGLWSTDVFNKQFEKYKEAIDK